MTRDDEVFAEALALPNAERAAFLDGACGGDAALRARVELLLANHTNAAGFLASPATARAFALPEEKPGDLIGRYKLLQKIGEGGCGVVWMAEQEEPVRRRVALKVIKLGMDTREVIARFEAERQALALMDHPNIARVLDGGATANGRPFFVMELVRGLPITRYCDEARLTPKQRLGLFIAVCQAVQHAHQKGVIHRDLKPSNILVTLNDGVALPKVIDFGIAKATQGPLTDKTLFTAFQQFIGTPVYMSPEQADLSSVDIDTRADIYSLGVLLYELLTGAPPFDSKTLLASGLDEIRRIIREVEPARPSSRVATLAAAERTTLSRQRSLGAAALSLALCGDLDWIVMRCLEKDRARRYETANALAADLRRHLAHEPVAARPPSAAYLFQKLVRRHRLAFGAAAAIAATLVLAAVVSTWQAFRATRAECEQSRLRVTESTQRQRAESAELSVRRRAYAADINLVQQALADDNLARAQTLLDRQRPRPGEIDLRDWEWRYLWQFARSDALSVLATKPDTTINSVAVSSDGTWLAAGEVSYGGLSVWNLRTKEEIRVPAGRSGVKVAFSPRDPLLAIAVLTEDPPYCRVWLWDLGTRRVARELIVGTDSVPRTAPGDNCSGLFFSEDGRTLVTSRRSPANEITLWRVADGRKIAVFPAGASAMDVRYSSFAVSRDLALAAYVKAVDRKLHVIDLATGRERWSANAADEYILALAFSPDGKLLVSGAGWTESAIRLWDVGTGAEVGRLEGHRRFVGQFAFWPDGKTLASVGGDYTVRIWDVPTRRLIRTLRGHRSEVNTLALLPDGRTLATGSKDGSVRLWDALADRAPGAFMEFPGGPVPAASRFSAASDALIYVDFAGRVMERRGRNFSETRILLELDPVDPPTPPVLNSSEAVVVAVDRPLVATRRNRDLKHIRVWDWERRTLVREFELAEGELGFIPAAFSPDAARLFVTSFRTDRTVRLEERSLGDGRRLREWPLPASAPVSVFSPDGKYFAVATGPGRFLRLNVAADEPFAWIRTELATGRQTVLPGNTRESGGSGASFSPDGRYFAGGSALGFVDLLDANSWQRVTALTGVMAGMYRPIFSASTARLVVGSSGPETVTMWDLNTFERLLTLPTTTSVVGVIGFSPDGNVLASRSSSGGMEGTSSALGRLFLWRAPSWAEIAEAEKTASH